MDDRKLTRPVARLETPKKKFVYSVHSRFAETRFAATL